MKVVIILPTYNEKGNIKLLIEQIEKIFDRINNYSFDILVVDDSSPDGTASEVSIVQNTYKNVYLLVNKKKIGLGKALLVGMDYAIQKLHAEVLLEMDADLSHDPKKIPEFLEKIDKGADFVIGSRYIKGGSIPERWGIHRKLFSRIGNILVRSILGIFRIHEWTSGFRAVRSRFFEDSKNDLSDFSGYTFQVAFLYKSLMRGAKIVEVPINFSERYYGRSKLAPLEYISNLLFYLITTRLNELWKNGFIKFCIVGTIGFLVNLVGLEFFFNLGVRPGPAAALGAEIAIVSNFLFNNFWTFSGEKIVTITRLIMKFIQFNVTSAGAVLIQGIVVGLGTHIYGDESRRIFLVLAIIFFIIPYSWFIYNRIIWKTHGK
ncbi:MAG: glycosyltransferase family 2 protein [Candidatus Gottesmanbacteria bacterium]